MTYAPQGLALVNMMLSSAKNKSLELILLFGFYVYYFFASTCNIAERTLAHKIKI